MYKMDVKNLDSLRTLSTTEVAAFLGCGRHHVEFLHNNGLLPYCRVAGKRRTLLSDVMEYIKKGGDTFTEAAMRRKNYAAGDVS